MKVVRLFARTWVCACLATALGGRAAAAQQPAPPDSTDRLDSLTRRPLTMQPVTITAAAPRRSEPSGAVTVAPEAIRRTPALNAYDLLRQSAGMEVHDQGQGAGFASDASIRGFSSDHSTDVALWIDGVPINEPVNGHAEGSGDWFLLMPQAVAGIEVFKGPTSALFGNFAMAGVVNVRTLERMSGVQLEATGGAQGRAETALLTGIDRDRTSAVLGLRGLREDGWRPNSGYTLGQLHGRWVRRVGAATTVDAGLELYGADWDSPGFLSDSLFQLHRFDVVADPATVASSGAPRSA